MSTYAVGDHATIAHIITPSAVDQFAELTGDTNPVHLDDDYAAQTRFKRRIAHGMLGAGLISAVLGTRLPGPGSIYLSQTLRFAAPIHLGDRLETRVEIIAMRSDKPIATLRTSCTNQDGVLVIDGEAVLMLPR